MKRLIQSLLFLFLCSYGFSIESDITSKSKAGAGISLNPTHGIGAVTITADVALSTVNAIQVRLDKMMQLETGSAGDMYFHNGSSVGALVPTGTNTYLKHLGSGKYSWSTVSGDTNDDISIPAYLFMTYDYVAGAYPVTITSQTANVPFEGFSASSRPIAEVVDFSNARDGSCDYPNLIMPYTWDNGDLTVYLINSSTGNIVDGTAWFYVSVSSDMAFGSGKYHVGQATVTITAEQQTRTAVTITPTGIMDGTAVTLTVWREVDDACTQTVRFLGCDLYYGVDK